MTTCRVCALDRAGAGPRAAAGGAGAALVVRAWREGGVLRARLLAVEPPHRTVATAQGTDAVCDAVRAWLGRL
jgi:hypothetical protein